MNIAERRWRRSYHNQLVETTKKIASRLQDNYNLYHISLMEELGPSERLYLDLNRHGRGRLLQNVETITTHEYVEALAGDNLSCTYYFLRSYPLLCHNEIPSHVARVVREDAKRKRG